MVVLTPTSSSTVRGLSSPFSLPAWVAPELNNETDSATAAAAGGALCAMPGARAPCMQL